MAPKGEARLSRFTSTYIKLDDKLQKVSVFPDRRAGNSVVGIILHLGRAAAMGENALPSFQLRARGVKRYSLGSCLPEVHVAFRTSFKV